MLAHMPMLIMLTPMPKCRNLLANLLVRCCAANATVAAVAQAADACDDAMLTCLQILYSALIILQFIY
jgi:hypothetical protein